MKNLKVTIIATLFIWVLLIGMIFTIQDRSTVNPYQEQSTLQHFTSFVNAFARN
jgi:hypothetical protein